MTTIHLETFIAAPVATCFDLARNVSLHLDSMSHTGERVMAGRQDGLCEVGDTIIWEATHLGIRQQLSVVITKMEAPKFFEDTMTSGGIQVYAP